MPPTEPISIEQLTRPVPLSEVSAWVEKLCARYTSDPSWQNYFLQKRGLTKDLQDELIPLGLLCKKIESRAPSALLHYYHGSKQSFDAKIVLPSGKTLETLEITLACDGYQDAIAAESLELHGYAPLYSPIPSSGPRASRQLPKPELVSLDADVVVAECIAQVQEAVMRKCQSRKYIDTNLVVAFDDFRLLSLGHFELVINELHAIKSSFPVVYYVGLGGRLFTQTNGE
jgi:hypothetical protein